MLFITKKVRNLSRSIATVQAYLGAINVLYLHAATHRIDLVERFTRCEFLDPTECEALFDSTQTDFGPEHRRVCKIVALGRAKRGHVYAAKVLKASSQYDRLTYISLFLEWLGAYLSPRGGSGRVDEIAAMSTQILALRPKVNGRSNCKGVSARQNALLVSLIEPGSPNNPFVVYVQVRNLLAIELMRLLGKRRGEALGIRVGDINLSKRQIDIIRRADDPADPRQHQPRTKTLEHTIAVGEGLAQIIDRYLEIRREVPGAKKHPYLLVTHKAGPTQGQPMTTAALYGVFRTLGRAEPALRGLHPHLLRHFQSDELAASQQSEAPTPESRESHRRIRNHVAGRVPDSGLDAVYTSREIAAQARAASLKHQEDQAARVKRVLDERQSKSVR